MADYTKQKVSPNLGKGGAGPGFNSYDPSINVNADGSAQAPIFNSILQNGKLDPNFKYNAQTVDPNSLEGFQKFKGEALRTGPSAYANLQNQALEMQRGNAIDKMGQQGDSALMGALRTLGSKGGIASGSGALAASDMARQKMLGKQGAYRDYTQGLNQVAQTDEQNRIGQLGTFADAEAKLAQTNASAQNQGSQFNLQNALSDIGQGRDYNKFLYGEGMKKWAADRTANAMENSANSQKAGGLLGSPGSALSNFGGALGPMGPGGIGTDKLGEMIGGDAGKAISVISNPTKLFSW